MIKSMTGYGRALCEILNKSITVELKSVNHRFFDCSIRSPRAFSYLEEPVKNLIKKEISRGKIDVYISIENIVPEPYDIKLNLSLAQGYIDVLKKLADEFNLDNDITLSKLSNFRDIFEVHKGDEKEEELLESVLTVTRKALDEFSKMRLVEGENLSKDLSSELDNISDAVVKIEALSVQSVEDYRTRLYNKLRELLDDRNIDESRLITEAAIFADRTAVNEETVRLKSHIKQFKGVLLSGGSVGKKLDFMVQELNREVNTIGSKSQNIEIANLVVLCKSSIEKIREQIQNIE